MKKTIGTNSIFIYPGFLIFVLLAIYVFTTENELESGYLFLMIVIFIIIFFDLIRHVLRPYQCIKIDQKNLYLYPLIKKEIVIPFSEIKDVSYHFRRRYGGLNITTKSNVKYFFRSLTNGNQTALEIKNMMTKKTGFQSLDDFDRS